MELIHDGQYFTINRARQYGKTTTLVLLERLLMCTPGYTCISLTFEGMGDAMFNNEEQFCQEFLIQAHEALGHTDIIFAEQWPDESVKSFAALGRHISKLCRNSKIVLLIDEVDQASNNQVFVQFLGMLRSLFLRKASGKAGTFHSVILAGVHDIKNIKLKLINDGRHIQQDEHERQYNSPWNIAAKFTVDMSFSATEISTMLLEYEEDYKTGMDITTIAEEIYRFTCGYPYLVSRICKCIDDGESSGGWTISGVQNAVRIIAFEKSVLKDDIFKNMENNKAIYEFMYKMLIEGYNKRISLFDPLVERCAMFGFISVDSHGNAGVSNKIFEMAMTDYFISKENSAAGVSNLICNGMYTEITQGGKFNMELCLRKFSEHYHEIYASAAINFLETHGRMIFLSFLKPLVNGNGFFHIESQFTDMRRMDVIVDYAREQFIIELKLWRGERAQGKAYEQLLNYMKSKGLGKGYLLTFDFREEGNKSPKAEWVQVGSKKIFDVII